LWWQATSGTTKIYQFCYDKKTKPLKKSNQHEIITPGPYHTAPTTKNTSSSFPLIAIEFNWHIGSCICHGWLDHSMLSHTVRPLRFCIASQLKHNYSGKSRAWIILARFKNDWETCVQTNDKLTKKLAFCNNHDIYWRNKINRKIWKVVHSITLKNLYTGCKYLKKR